MKPAPHPNPQAQPLNAAKAMSASAQHQGPVRAAIEAVDMRLAECAGTALPGWRLGWAQVIGRHHPRFSEDSLAHHSALQPGGVVGSPLGLFLAVADGVGGGARGEVASAALTAHSVALPHALLGKPEGIAQWMQLAEGQVQLKLREVSHSPGAATLAAAWLQPAGPSLQRSNGQWQKPCGEGAQGHIMRVGDARLYRFDGQSLEALTTDQTYQAVGDPPAEGASPDDPARMVGTGHTGTPELQPLHLPWGHTLLLCSDGLHRGLSTGRMAELMREGGELSACALRLALAARLGGSDDDITVLLAQPSLTDDNDNAAPPAPMPSPSPWRSLFKRVFS
ncbi:MAG: protein phosphatase 2C domain-containing protein [Candidatus Saccharibacteria bacterium]|nr:protein phosphatase 2C domain-containing protein [Rhodoferax sp.]